MKLVIFAIILMFISFTTIVPVIPVAATGVSTIGHLFGFSSSPATSTCGRYNPNDPGCGGGGGGVVKI